MIRVIPLDSEDTGFNFALWNTVVDRFYHINGSEAWDTWHDFEADFKTEFPKMLPKEKALLERIEGLIPKEYK